MTQAQTNPQKEPDAIAAEQRILLHNISWQTFETMLAEMGEHRALRLSYDQGTLEIMSPLMPHERSNRQIERLIFILAEELGLGIVSVGSMTCKREDLQRGVEPDSSYYIQHEPLVRDKETINLDQDPPPDLVLEVEYASSALNKFQIYAALGVPEFWRYDGRTLRVYKLETNQYIQCETSPTFAPVAVTEIPQFLESSRKIGEIAMTKAFRIWVRQQMQAEP